MNNQEIAIKDLEKPLSEEPNVPVDTQEGVAPHPEANASSVDQQSPLTSTSFKQPVQPSWPGYTPAPPPLWAGQPGRYYPPTQNKPGRWPWIVLTFFLLFLLMIGGALFLFGAIGYTGFSSSSTETRNFTVTANPTFVLNNDTGSIHVRASSSDNVITIQATKHGSFWGNQNDIRVSYAQNTEANTVTVNVDRLNNSITFFTSASVDFDVTIPATAALQLKTNTGSIDVSGVSGEMVLTSNTGSIGVNGGTVSGTTDLTTNTGSVTFNGAIDRSGTYHFGTNTGSVNVTLPGESAFHVDASTDTGSINTNFSGVSVQHNQVVGANAYGDVGSSPRATLSLRTNTGSINLYQR